MRVENEVLVRRNNKRQGGRAATQAEVCTQQKIRTPKSRVLFANQAAGKTKESRSKLKLARAWLKDATLQSFKRLAFRDKGTLEDIKLLIRPWGHDLGSPTNHHDCCGYRTESATPARHVVTFGCHRSASCVMFKCRLKVP
jgi:hypothetical protein